MKNLFFLFFLAACSTPKLVNDSPTWVSSLRSGESSLKVQQGSKVFYRRIAGGKDVSKQTSCDLVILKAEEDIKKEYPINSKIPYVVEVLYYDQEHQDCAVTLSVDKNLKVSDSQESLDRRNELLKKETVTDEEAAELLSLRSEIAAKYALTGLTKEEFEKFSKERVVMQEGDTLCAAPFNTDSYSIHGITHVCWSRDHVRGYCTTRTKQCWIRTP